MVGYKFDDIEFHLKEACDVSWLREFGKVFAVYDQNDSGNISFGVDNGKEKFFIKVAGLSTMESTQTKEEAVTALKAAMPVYENIRHKNLIDLVRHYAFGDMYLAIFKWVEGECLFDHWNFEKYDRDPEIIPPAKRFKQLPITKRLNSADVLFSFLDAVSKKGYVAVDFYDGSIMYDFGSDTTTICDIDLFRKKPAANDMGKDYWGTKRVKAPEEYCYGAVIDEATNVYTLGAVLFNSFFGHYTDQEIRQMYEKSAFMPCPLSKWELNKKSYEVVSKAVSKKRSERYSSIHEFYMAWKEALVSIFSAHCFSRS